MRIETLGQDFATNGDLIIETERLLGRLVDTELRDKLEDYKVYEILHAEHLSPHFLDMCKKTVQNDNISDICFAERLYLVRKIVKLDTFIPTDKPKKKHPKASHNSALKLPFPRISFKLISLLKVTVGLNII